MNTPHANSHYYILSEKDPKMRRRVQEILQREGLTSYMNNTKWREVCDGVHDLPFLPGYQVKILGCPAPEWELEYAPEGNWDWAITPEAAFGIFIEWVKITPRMTIVTQRGYLLSRKIEVVDCTDELLALFRRLRLPFLEQDGFVMLYGHGKGLSFDI